MLTLGSEGIAQQQLAQLLKWNEMGMNEDSIIEQYQKIEKIISKTKSVEILTANSIWSSKLLKSYVSNITSKFNASAKKLRTEKEINQWVADKTKNLITKLIEELPNPCPGVLVNAIYFKGNWARKFSSCKNDKFFLQDKSVVNAEMMNIQGKYAANLSVHPHGITAIEIPYDGNEFSMIAILPSKTQSWNEFINLPSETFFSVIDKLSMTNVNLFFPKFEIDFGVVDISDNLIDLGVSQVFSTNGDAGLSRLSDDPLVFVSSVFHRAVCKVNETGTEAAAATAVVLGRGGRRAPACSTIKFNEPFLFMIVQKTTNLVIFAGTMVNPTKK